MRDNNLTTAQDYYNEAEKMLEENNLIAFMENIGSAKVLAEDEEALAKITFLTVKGLLQFHQHKKGLEKVEEALQYNKGRDALIIKQYAGIMHGYLNDFEKAISIFESIIEETDWGKLLYHCYHSIAWIRLLSYSTGKEDYPVLKKVKKNLDMAFDYIEQISDRKKINFYDNYSIYWHYREDAKKAIDLLKESLQYCDERDLAEKYIKLAEFYWDSNLENRYQKMAEYVKKTEDLTIKFNDKLTIAKKLSIRARLEIKEGQIPTAVNTLFTALRYFNEVESYPYASDCIKEINRLMKEYLR